MFKNYIAGQGLAYILPNQTILFENVAFELNKGEKTALIGENGVGKTTFFKIICGELEPSRGNLIISGIVASLSQDIHKDKGTISEVIGLKAKLKALSRINQGTATDEDWDVIGNDWDLESRIEKEFFDWELEYLTLENDFSKLSGGEKEKILLIRSFLAESDFLLLDEPTNNLDLKAKKILEQKIIQTEKAVLLVTHDREILRQMNAIWELNSQGIEKFGGDYEFYLNEKIRQKQQKEDALDNCRREENLLIQKKAETERKSARQNKYGEKQAESRRYSRCAAGLKKISAQNTKSRKISNLNEKLEKSAEETQKLSLALREEMIKIPLPGRPFIRNRLLAIEDLDFGYDEELLITHLNLIMKGDDRVAISGGNGSGKTTLLKLILGSLKPSAGSVSLNGRAVYLNQDLNLLATDQSLVKAISLFNPSAKEQDIRKTLANFKFRNIAGEKIFGLLSGGEKLRGCLAAIFCTIEQPDLIILDEPTNNLDIKSLEILEESLVQYQGALLVVSHDQEFLKNIKISHFIQL